MHDAFRPGCPAQLSPARASGNLTINRPQFSVASSRYQRRRIATITAEQAHTYVWIKACQISRIIRSVKQLLVILASLASLASDSRPYVLKSLAGHYPKCG
jgi:hypothetical protein